MRGRITTDAWLAELQNVMARPRASDPGLTVNEMAAQCACRADKVRSALRTLQAEGRLILGRKAITGIDGRRAESPCYRLAPPVKAKRR